MYYELVYNNKDYTIKISELSKRFNNKILIKKLNDNPNDILKYNDVLESIFITDGVSPNYYLFCKHKKPLLDRGNIIINEWRDALIEKLNIIDKIKLESEE